MKRPSYLVVGALYAVLSLPAWWAVFTGSLAGERSPHLLLALVGTPTAAAFLAFGLGWGHDVRRTWMALRVSWISLGFVVVVLASLVAVRAGVVQFMTSVIFSGMAASYLALVALVLLLSGARARS